MGLSLKVLLSELLDVHVQESSHFKTSNHLYVLGVIGELLRSCASLCSSTGRPFRPAVRPSFCPSVHSFSRPREIEDFLGICLSPREMFSSIICYHFGDMCEAAALPFWSRSMCSF